jgi:hypothetical protein
MSEQQEKRITVDDKIPYVDCTKRYDMAEFGICTRFFRGRLTDIYFTRMQQPSEKQRQYHLNVKEDFPHLRVTCFCIDAWSHKTDHPRIWRQFWCKEHKAICHETYVPRHTNSIEFNLNFGDTITIRFVQNNSCNKTETKEKL